MLGPAKGEGTKGRRSRHVSRRTLHCLGYGFGGYGLIE